MERFVEYKKLSKKRQKEINNKKRKTWGIMKPIIKVKASAKVYNRKNKQALMNFNYSSKPVYFISS